MSSSQQNSSTSASATNSTGTTTATSTTNPQTPDQQATDKKPSTTDRAIDSKSIRTPYSSMIYMWSLSSEHKASIMISQLSEGQCERPHLSCSHTTTDIAYLLDYMSMRSSYLNIWQIDRTTLHKFSLCNVGAFASKCILFQWHLTYIDLLYSPQTRKRAQVYLFHQATN